MMRNDSIDGPGFWNVDLSLVKRFRFGDRVSTELRADAFNAFNHPNFGNPNGELRRRHVRPGHGHVGLLRCRVSSASALRVLF